MTWIYAFDLIGTLVFAISGVLIAIDKKFDLVGSTIIGLVTAVGGGTLRDLLIGNTPVGWLKDFNYLLVVCVAVLFSYLFKDHTKKIKRAMFLFDTLGIGLFTILGIQKTMAIGLSIPMCILMGTTSAVFGGIIRDVLTNEIPLIFRKEIYATACLIGGLVFVLLEHIISTTSVNMIISMSIVVLIRYLSVKNNWSLYID